MPPSDRPQPTAQEREKVLAWIENVFAGRTLAGHPDPGPLRPRRLNAREHRNTFRDLAVTKGNGQPRRVSYTPKPNGIVSLYDAVIPPPEHPCAFVARTLPQDTNDGGFDTIADNLSIPPFLLEKYFRCSKVLLDEMFSVNPGRGSSYQWPLYHEVMKLQKGPYPKGMTPRQALTAFLKEFATRAFRRPVTAEEVEKYARLFDQSQQKGEPFEASIRLPLQAILVSPRFVVLWADASVLEKVQGEGDAAPVRPLDDHELAARLSYFLWSSLPDRELFQAAQQGRLQRPAGAGTAGSEDAARSARDGRPAGRVPLSVVAAGSAGPARPGRRALSALFPEQPGRADETGAAAVRRCGPGRGPQHPGVCRCRLGVPLLSAGSALRHRGLPGQEAAEQRPAAVVSGQVPRPSARRSADDGQGADRHVAAGADQPGPPRQMGAGNHPGNATSASSAQCGQCPQGREGRRQEEPDRAAVAWPGTGTTRPVPPVIG